MLFLSLGINQMLVCSLLLMCGVAHHYYNLYSKQKNPFKKGYNRFQLKLRKLNNTVINKTFSIQVIQQWGILGKHGQIWFLLRWISWFTNSSISKSFCTKSCKAVPPWYVWPLPTTPHWKRKPKGGRLQPHGTGATPHQQATCPTTCTCHELSSPPQGWQPWLHGTQGHTQNFVVPGDFVLGPHALRTLRQHFSCAGGERGLALLRGRRVLGDLVAGLTWLVPRHPQRAHGLQRQHFHLPGSPGDSPFQTGVHLKKQMDFSLWLFLHEKSTRACPRETWSAFSYFLGHKG